MLFRVLPIDIWEKICYPMYSCRRNRCVLFLFLQHNMDYVAAADLGRFLYYQPHPLHPPAVFRTGADDIDAGGVDTAVAENIRQLCNVFFNSVKHPCE